MGNVLSKMSEEKPLLCDCSEDTDVRGRCDTDEMECKMRDDTVLLQIKNDYELMHADQIVQLNWLLERKVSHANVIKFFEDTT